MKIYSKPGGIFSKRILFFAELYKENQLRYKYEIEEKYINQFTKTYQGLFEISNRPIPKFTDSERAVLQHFIESGLLLRMVGDFLGGQNLTFKEEGCRITIEANRGQFNLSLVGDSGKYVWKANSMFERIDPDFNIRDCEIPVSKIQVELFLACIGYKFSIDLLSGYSNHISSSKITSDSIYDILLSLPNEWLSSIAKCIINNRC